MTSTVVFKINCKNEVITCTKTSEGYVFESPAHGRVVFQSLQKLNDVTFWKDLIEDNKGFLTEEEIEDVPFLYDSYWVYKTLLFLQYHEDKAYPEIKKPIVSSVVTENLELGNNPKEFYEQFISEFINEKLVKGQVSRLHQYLVECVNGIAYTYLLDFCCSINAALIKNKTPREVLAYYGLPELTPDEEDKLRRDNQWIFDVRPKEATPSATPAAPADVDVPDA